MYLSLNLPRSMCKQQLFKDFKHDYVFLGCPIIYKGIAVPQRKVYQILRGFLAGKTNVCSFVFLHGRSI